jgi:antitoxin CptB
MDDHALLDERALSKLKWRCRRGLLENDLFIERFFARHESGMTVRQARAMNALMDLSDNDLLDLLLKRKEPTGALATDEVLELLGLLRSPTVH